MKYRLLERLLVYITLTGIWTTATSQPISLTLTEVTRGIVSPVGMACPDDGTNRMFVHEQGGKIKIIKDGKLLEEPFLNISSKLDGLNIAYSEKGLLGLAFHPDYKNNGRLFVYYSAPYKHPSLDHKSIIAEYHVSKTDMNKAAPEEIVIMEIYQPESNHNGGMLAFGSDMYLYIGTGDGGGGGDQHGTIGNGQNLNTLLGKILRIDVNGRKPYAIPYDNPFVGQENTRAEIWAYGLRNPWRFSFDAPSGKLFCGDVGQNTYEEVNIIEKGGNYGWRIMEGLHCFDPKENCPTNNLIKPIAEYDHGKGISVCGGYVYRGNNNPLLQGHYIFGDWSGKLFILAPQPGGTWKFIIPDVDDSGSNDISGKINAMGQDQNGEIYLLTQKLFGPKSPTGIVYRVSQKK